MYMYIIIIIHYKVYVSLIGNIFLLSFYRIISEYMESCDVSSNYESSDDDDIECEESQFNDSTNLLVLSAAFDPRFSAWGRGSHWHINF